MAKYIYQKYRVTSTYSYSNRKTVQEDWTAYGTWPGWKLYSGYNYNTSQGFYSTGSHVGYPISGYTTNGYFTQGNAVMRFEYTSGSGWRYKVLETAIQNVRYSRGSYVEDVIAEDGAYPSNGRHSDGYWYVKGGLANMPPEIMVSAPPNGVYGEKPVFEYVVSDVDGDTITVTEKIDGMVIRSFTTEGGSFTYTPGDLDWIKTRINTTVNCEIIADDGKGGVTTKAFPVMRKETAIDIKLKNPFVTDVAARRIMLNLDGAIPVTVNALIQVCNNAFDNNPTWENATTMVLQGFPYPFENTAKTANEWGVSFRIRVERGEETGDVYLSGIGGAFD